MHPNKRDHHGFNPVWAAACGAVALLAALIAPTAHGSVDTKTGTEAPSTNAFDSRVLEKAYGSERDLKKAHKRYQRIADRGGFTRIEGNAVLEVGDTGPAVLQLRQRLSEEDYDVAKKGETYDEALASVVRTMQERNGLLVDGKIGPETRAALNVSAADRARQLEINLERRREPLASAGAERGIVVNLAGQRLHAISGKRATTMKVIVGKPSWATPRLDETLEYVVVNPYWTIPIEIIAAELKEEVMADLSVLEEKNMKVFAELGPNAEPLDPSTVDWAAIDASDPDSFPYYLRQMPGPENPLGLIKFMMPNNDDIYLHDTPADELFNEHDRELSHGCIRLERPLDLAEFVAPLTDWTRTDFEKAIDSGEFETVQLSRTIPVELVYWTAWVDPSGTVQFREDIYGHDDI